MDKSSRVHSIAPPLNTVYTSMDPSSSQLDTLAPVESQEAIMADPSVPLVGTSLMEWGERFPNLPLRTKRPGDSDLSIRDNKHSRLVTTALGITDVPNIPSAENRPYSAPPHISHSAFRDPKTHSSDLLYPEAVPLARKTPACADVLPVNGYTPEEINARASQDAQRALFETPTIFAGGPDDPSRTLSRSDSASSASAWPPLQAKRLSASDFASPTSAFEMTSVKSGKLHQEIPAFSSSEQSESYMRVSDTLPPLQSNVFESVASPMTLEHSVHQGQSNFATDSNSTQEIDHGIHLSTPYSMDMASQDIFGTGGNPHTSLDHLSTLLALQPAGESDPPQIAELMRRDTLVPPYPFQLPSVVDEYDRNDIINRVQPAESLLTPHRRFPSDHGSQTAPARSQPKQSRPKGPARKLNVSSAGDKAKRSPSRQRTKNMEGKSAIGNSAVGLTTPKPTRIKEPHSVSKVDRLKKSAAARTIMNSCASSLRRFDYDPFLDCAKHTICLARSKLSADQVCNGWYYKSESRKAGRDKDGPAAVAESLVQAVRSNGQPYVRTYIVEDTSGGLANLMQLHMTRAIQHRNEHRRPLLHPSASAGSTTNPIYRILQSKRFYAGRFFTKDGTSQTKDCILVNFPKNHRGDVRLQMKVWNNPDEVAAAASATPTTPSRGGKGKKKNKPTQQTAKKEDIKAHILSYICWIYGVSGQIPRELGQWPTNLRSTCEWGHKTRHGDDNDEFLCINPFHYCKETGGSDCDETALKRSIESRCLMCIKDMPHLEGETDVDGKCMCFCHDCRVGREEFM